MDEAIKPLAVINNQNPPHPEGPKLTKKNKKFCEFFNDFANFKTFGNGAESARKAGYSPTNAASVASKLLTQANIQQYLTKLDEDIKARTNFSRNDAIHIGLTLLNECPTWAVKARFYEIVCKIKGYLADEDTQSKNQMALFQVLDAKITQKLGIMTDSPTTLENDALSTSEKVRHIADYAK